METPKEWPNEIATNYDPIRVLGTGGFASVVLARKTETESNTSNTNSSLVAARQRVAIKVVGSKDPSGDQAAYASKYARREIELLQQIHHAGIVKLFHSWEQHHTNDDGGTRKHPSPTAGVLVLEYLKGPTVESLLTHGGALSTMFGRVVIAQIMDAVAYLHYRAVLHRDIKPDNIIVTGALSSDPFIWDNDVIENEDDPSTPMDRDSKSSDEWKRLCFKYKAKIIDFGFARALTPEDMESPAEESSETSDRPLHETQAGYHNVHSDDDLKSQKKRAGGKLNEKPLRLFGSEKDLSELDDTNHSSQSVSHKLKRVMSTLGNRQFAAPEILEKVRHITPQEKRTETLRARNNPKRASETTKTISNYVANYGVLADSYSMGHTIRYMMTGVKPGVSVEDTLRKQQRSELKKKVLTKLGLKKKKPRKPFYRSLNDVPGMILVLVEDLTEISVHRRVSIRKARRYAWISDVLAFQEYNIINTSNNNTIHHPSKGLEVASTNEENSRLPEPSLEHVSEEQLQELHETRYLPLATTTPMSVVSTHTTKTFVMFNNSSQESSNPTDDDDFLEVEGLESGGITF